MSKDKKEQELQKIQELIELMVANNLVEMEIINGESKIHLKRPEPQQQVITPVPMMASPVAAGPMPVPAKQTEGATESGEEELIDIKAPMVGTFYAAPSPDSEPYVQEGVEVMPETVVCIIEAMKVMNEIKAETTGVIAKIAVANGQAVEYGQVLFRVGPH